jgi:hypothetical protein
MPEEGLEPRHADYDGFKKEPRSWPDLVARRLGLLLLVARRTALFATQHPTRLLRLGKRKGASAGISVGMSVRLCPRPGASTIPWVTGGFRGSCRSSNGGSGIDWRPERERVIWNIERERTDPDGRSFQQGEGVGWGERGAETPARAPTPTGKCA